MRAACATQAPPAGPRTIAGVNLPGPLPPRPQTDTFFGLRMDDPWRYTENVNDPVVADWMKGQATASKQMLAQLPVRGALLERVRAIDAAARGKQAGQLFKALTRAVDVVTTAVAWAAKANNPALALAVETLRKGTRSA